MRERGLKHYYAVPCNPLQMSLPMRERGLKQIVYKRYFLSVDFVAPHAGAWIETNVYGELGGGEYVAPHAGAWIETR